MFNYSGRLRFVLNLFLCKSGVGLFFFEGYRLESIEEGFRPAQGSLEGDGLEQRLRIS